MTFLFCNVTYFARDCGVLSTLTSNIIFVKSWCSYWCFYSSLLSHRHFTMLCLHVVKTASQLSYVKSKMIRIFGNNVLFFAMCKEETCYLYSYPLNALQRNLSIWKQGWLTSLLEKIFANGFCIHLPSNSIFVNIIVFLLLFLLFSLVPKQNDKKFCKWRYFFAMLRILQGVVV